jgi:hypothetical protein
MLALRSNAYKIYQTMSGEYGNPRLTTDEKLYRIAGRFGQSLVLRDIGEDYCNGREKYPSLEEIDLTPLVDAKEAKTASLRACYLAYKDPGQLKQELRSTLNAAPRVHAVPQPAAALQKIGLAAEKRSYGSHPLAEGVVQALHLLERYTNNRQLTMAQRLWRAAEAAIEMTPFFIDQAQQRLEDPGNLPTVVEGLARDYIYYVGDTSRPVETVELPD